MKKEKIIKEKLYDYLTEKGYRYEYDTPEDIEAI